MRQRFIERGLNPPPYKQNPLFRLVVQHPKKFQPDFLKLPRRMQDNLLQILNANGGDDFNADELLTPPVENQSFGVEEVFKFETPQKPEIDDELQRLVDPAPNPMNSADVKDVENFSQVFRESPFISTTPMPFVSSTFRPMTPMTPEEIEMRKNQGIFNLFFTF